MKNRKLITIVILALAALVAVAVVVKAGPCTPRVEALPAEGTP
jgi:hypothetical protein